MPRKIALLSLLLVAWMAGSAAAGYLSPGLEAQFAQKQDAAPVKVLVVLRDRVDIQALDLNLHEQRVDLATRHVTVIETLKNAANSSQVSLLADLAARQSRAEVVKYKAHWLINAIMVTATESVIREIAARDDVEIVEVNLVPQLIQPASIYPATDGAKGDRSIGITPGVVNIGARRVWNELGIRGEGALIGSNDTGVDGTHPALANRWRGLNHPWQECWLDLLGTNTQFPNDTNSHGTHCTGTMAGVAPNDTIGVAPGAEWIATNPINQGVNPGFDQDIIDSFEWFTDPDGNPFTMDDVPDVVQNSWGINEGFGYLDCDSRWWTVLDGCEAAGPVIVWAAGNEGPGATTLRSPADRATTLYNSFSVGATSHTSPYTIASFSSRGPAGPNCGPVENRVKPEVSAPGVSIYSAQPGGGYQYMDGTSMACPHVAGVVALMRSANPNVDVITIKEVLMATAHDLGTPGEDNTYGRGFIDAYQAVLSVMGGLSHIQGTVTNAVTGLPIAGVQVSVVGGFQTATTAANGSYSLTVQIGTHTVAFAAFGYATRQETVDVVEAQPTILSPALTPVASATVSGIVYLSTGLPAVGATVSVNAPVAAVTTDALGHYAFTLPSSGDYTFTAVAGAGGFLVLTAPVVGDLNLDLYLNPISIEGFESGNLNAYPWVLSGNGNWAAQTAVTHAGGWAARSGAIGHNQTSQMQVTVNCGTGGNMSFWYKVSSESNYDYLRFFVDGAEITQWSGEQGWAQYTRAVTGGNHTFAFRYSKDGSVVNGSDAGFVDDIVFPGGSTPVPNLVVTPQLVSVSMDLPIQVVSHTYIFNQGAAPLSFSLSESAPWLTVAPAMGTVAAGTYAAIDFTFDGDLAPQGISTANVTVTSNDPTGGTVVITAQLEVAGDLTAVDGDTPAAFGLVGAMPNPFNPMTTVRFVLAESARATLSIYDVQGRLVRTLVDSVLPAGLGEARWNGQDNRGNGVASGTYFARLVAGTQTSVKTLTLVR
jgi:subtilisin family serine protease